MSVLLDVNQLSIRLRTPQGVLAAVRDVSFSLAAGESLGIVGESGSGKSLTALALMGLLPRQAETQGQVVFEGQDLTQLPPADLNAIRGARMAMVFQDPMTSLNPYLRIGVQMAEVLEQHRGLSHAQALAESLRMLDAVQLSEAARRLSQYPHELSGGQRQRVLLAMALLCKPKLLIADEATTALDVTVQARVLELLADLRREMGLALIFISHDLGVVSEVCDRTLVMYGGRIMESAPTTRLLADPQHPYTQALVSSRPSLHARRGAELSSISGQPPRLSEMPVGCPFALRCGQRLPVCHTQMPEFIEISSSKSACWLHDGILPDPSQ